MTDEQFSQEVDVFNESDQLIADFTGDIQAVTTY